MRKVLFILALMLGLGVFVQPIAAKGDLKAYCSDEGVEVKVRTCRADANGNVIVTFTLKNVNHDGVGRAELRSGKSEVYDDEGNIYQGKGTLKFSDSKGMFQDWWDVKLPKNIPVKYKMKIANVDPAASCLSLVKIFGYNLGSIWIYLENVPITRDGD